ncbi:MAG: holo-ACP synthase [Candidatus Izemoplasmatales bacterium]
MIIGIGTDIVKITRVRPSIVRKVLSPEETAQMESFVSEQRKIEFLAGRFAVKEAIKKAMPSFEKFSSMTELVILNTEAGAPYLSSPVFEDKVIHLSISHEREYAIGLCVVERKEI